MPCSADPARDCGATLPPQETPLPAPRATASEARPLPRLAVARHVRQTIRTCWELGRLSEFAALKLWTWHTSSASGAHFSTKSRHYSTTLGALHAARRA